MITYNVQPGDQITVSGSNETFNVTSVSGSTLTVDGNMAINLPADNITVNWDITPTITQNDEFTIHAQDGQDLHTVSGGDLILRAGDIAGSDIGGTITLQPGTGSTISSEIILEKPGKDITAQVGEIWIHDITGLISTIHSVGFRAYNLKVLYLGSDRFLQRGKHFDFAMDTFHGYWTLLDTNKCHTCHNHNPCHAKEALCFGCRSKHGR